MSRPTRTATFAVGGALVASLALPGVATAEEARPADSPDRVAGVERTSEDSLFFAGYVAPLKKKDKSIIGTFTVPTLDCGAEDEASASLIELATEGGGDWVDGLVFSNCVEGAGTHQAVFHTTTEAGVVDIAEIVEDGDEITVDSVYKKKKDKITVTMTNNTQGWEATDSFTGINPEEASALVYSVELAAGDPSLPPLSENVPFDNVTVQGKDLKKKDPVKYNWVDENGDNLVKPTKIKSGTDFTAKYVG